MFGPIGREILSLGTIVFAVFAVVSIIIAWCIVHYPALRPWWQGSELLSGQLALSTLSDNGLCAVDLLLIFSAATFVLSLPRALGQMNWLGLVSTVAITLCGVLAMVGAGASPTSGRSLSATIPTTFYEAFLAITGPVSTESLT